MSGRMTAEQTPDIAAVLAEHAVSAKTPSDTACRCDRTWRKDADYRAHVAQALAPVLAAERVKARAAALRNPYDEDGYCEFCGNGSWKAHMPECSWADLRDAKAAAWDEGYTSGHSNAMRRMSDEPNAPTTPNPYRADRIAVDAPEGGA